MEKSDRSLRRLTSTVSPACEISSAAVDSTVESIVHAGETVKRSPVADRKQARVVLTPAEIQEVLTDLRTPYRFREPLLFFVCHDSLPAFAPIH